MTKMGSGKSRTLRVIRDLRISRISWILRVYGYQGYRVNNGYQEYQGNQGYQEYEGVLEISRISVYIKYVEDIKGYQGIKRIY